MDVPQLDRLAPHLLRRSPRAIRVARRGARPRKQQVDHHRGPAGAYCPKEDPWWNPAVEAQAIDRAHRIGQTRPVVAYRLLVRGTVEDKVAELQKKRSAVAAAVLGGDEASLGALTMLRSWRS